MPKKSNQPYRGKIRVRVFLGTENGRKKYKSVYGSTQKEADQKAQRLRNLLGKGIDIASQDDSFGQWAQKWLRIKEAEVSESWYRNLEGYINKCEPLHSIPIVKLNTSDIQDFILLCAKKNPKTNKPTSRRTLKGYLDTIENVIQLAIDNRVMDYNPARAVKLPAAPPKLERRALTKEEQKWIVDTPHRAQRAAMIMMYSGLRRGELIPLTWQDIDFNEQTISVNKTVEMIGGRPRVKPTAKTDSSLRTVDIPNILTSFLKEERQKDIAQNLQSSSVVSMLVCPAASGEMITDTAWRRMWESYIVDLNFKYGNRIDRNGNVAKSKYNKNGIILTIPNITAHWLRHTFATMLYLSGVDVLTARDQLGHSDIKTTLEIYTHLDRIYKKKNITKLNDYLSREA